MLLFRAEADTAVCDRKSKQDSLITLFHALTEHGNLTLFGKLDGVTHEVVKDLADAAWITPVAAAQYRIRRTDQLQPFLLSTKGEG